MTSITTDLISISGFYLANNGSNVRIFCNGKPVGLIAKHRLVVINVSDSDYNCCVIR